MSLVTILTVGCSFDPSGFVRDGNGQHVGEDAAPGAPDAAPGAPDPRADAAPVASADAAPAAPIGQPCPTGSECGAGRLCLDERVDPALFPAQGYCTSACASDGDCGPGAFCAPPFDGGTRLCFARCAGGDCDLDGYVCTDTLAGVMELGAPACLPGTPDAIDGDPCASFADCAPGQFCANNFYEAPGGTCVTVGCTPGDDSTCAAGGDGVCVVAQGVPLCVDRCDVTTDCRAAEGYSCVISPGTDNLCLFIHAEPGASCNTDDDCASGGAWVCRRGAGFPGGYCTGLECDPDDSRTCPGDSHCYDPTPPARNGDEYCVADCTGDDDCRPSYDCQPDDPADPDSPRGCR